MDALVNAAAYGAGGVPLAQMPTEMLDRHLEGRTFIAGEAYSIADIACWPWILSHKGHGQSLEAFPNLARWFESIRERPATQRAFADYRDPYAVVRHPAEEIA